ncbi:MAG: UDP-N-acetylmuramoyl-L-alanyl-D-glutamate--2,6-diaminopimelate ligase [Anaerolineaceae bacterium]|nr:UDP-N-acetylmuramoyl-L-alanyl-D-glutamate--2,6-diaminopimelate ligase [Anaerolineaceae bacterium]
MVDDLNEEIMIGFVHQTLAQLFGEIPIKPVSPDMIPEVVVTGVAFDSRAVQPGQVFVALVGGNVDGHRYIPAAVERGAVAVVGSQPASDINIPYIRVEDTRAALAYLSAALYGFPGRNLNVIGVTGTDGKTTTSNLVYQILLSAGKRAGILSTLNAVIGNEVLDTGFHVTTPEAPDVQRYLARMVVAGLTDVVIESTSHGLAQHRVTGCEFDIGIVTNITHEHLDYHGSYEAYRAAKARLFTSLDLTGEKQHGNPRLAVLNKDDQSYEYLKSVTAVRQVSYGIHPGADIWAEEIHQDTDGLHFNVRGSGLNLRVDSSLVGEYNVSNCLAAIAATAIGLGTPVKAIQAGIAALHGVPGRMERIDLGQDFLAIVDFAHTPNALRSILETSRQLTTGRVLVVFGSAGLRDRQKRHMMAEISAQLADVTILTAEDPRTESLDAILAEMGDSARSHGGVEGQTYWLIPDRGEALRLAVQKAQAGDVVVACGKGHEQSMCFGEKEYAWDDRTALRAAVAERLGIDGPPMPYLPTQVE